MAGARTLPLLMWSLHGGEMANINASLPPSRSVTASEPPLYGTCTTSMPAMLREKFHREMACAADAARAKRVFARIRPGKRDELFHRVRGTDG
jgi:hypothetical protein